MTNPFIYDGRRWTEATGKSLAGICPNDVIVYDGHVWTAVPAHVERAMPDDFGELEEEVSRRLDEAYGIAYEPAPEPAPILDGPHPYRGGVVVEDVKPGLRHRIAAFLERLVYRHP